MRCIVHIGVPKTGSKALQRVLTTADRSGERKWVYLRTGRAGLWHRPLHDALQRGSGDRLSALRREVAACASDVAILSYENFVDLGVEAVARLRGALGDARIVLFMRRQDRLLESRINQFIKGHRVPVSEIDAFKAEPMAVDPSMDFAATIRRWRGVFGDDAVVPVIYDKRGSVEQAFFAAAGLPAEMAEGDENTNAAADGESLSIFYQLKRMAGPEDDLSELMRCAHAERRPHFIDTRHVDLVWMPADTRERVLSLYAEGNEWVRASYFPQRAVLFDEVVPQRHIEFDLRRCVSEARDILRRYRASCVSR